jgi:hypothetical protein
MNGLQGDDPETPHHRGKLENGRVTDSLADERETDWRRHAHVTFLELDGVTEHETESLAGSGLFIFDRHFRPEPHFIGRYLADVDGRQLAQPLAQLAEPGLHELLPLERGLVFAVLTEIAVFDRSPDLSGKRDVQLMLQPLGLCAYFGFVLLDNWGRTGVGEIKIRAPGPAERALADSN